ncbi:MAG TPA: DNA polymerase I [Acidobacteriaceae bacterium]|nr:DNA polymerase I [Acidobacteriaceae bacterium]
MMATESGKPAIYLLDTMGFIFRAYHAMQRQRPMSTRSGIPTAAIYVFVNMLNKLRRDFNPQYLAAVFDVSAPVFRDERARTMARIRKFNVKTQKCDEIDYAGYKANRAEMPLDLAQQLPYIRRALEALRIPILQQEGFEADDVIGTLSHQASHIGHPVYIVSNDKDMLQLVGDDVFVLNPVKDNLVLDRAGVVEVLGVPPEQVVDVMALRGDSIDNIPGAPGIGDKGSVDLIVQFGSVEAALDRANEVIRKTYRESLLNNRENILLSKELVTIHCNVPVELRLDELQTRPPDLTACRDLFTELEFTTLIKDFGAEEKPKQTANLVLEPTTEQLRVLLASARDSTLVVIVEPHIVSSPDQPAVEEEIAFQETAQQSFSLLDGMERPEVQPESAAVFALGLAVDDSVAYRVRCEGEAAGLLRSALEDATLPKSVHDLKSLLRIMRDHQVQLAGVRDELMLYSYLLNPTHSTHRLEDVAARFDNQSLRGEGQEALPMAAATVARLAPQMRNAVERAQIKSIYESIDLPLTPVLLDMEDAGVRIDSAYLQNISRRLAAQMAELAECIYGNCGHRFNINSPKQLGDVLFNKMALPRPIKYGRGKVVSTAQDVLEELAAHHDAPRMVLEYRQLAKLKSNYSDSLPLLADAENRVHTTFNAVGTSTGRLSSTNPNLQNIPIRTELGREIRAAFIPAEGNVLISADYSQIELRLMAHFSEDPLLLKAYRENVDIHTLTASEVFGVPIESMDRETRNRAKAVNFGIVYGISPFGLAQQLNIEPGEARIYIDRYFERYQGVRAFIDRTLEEVRRTQAVRTLFGRVRPIPDITSRNANMRGFSERTAVNTPLQGTAADLIKLAMIRLADEIRQHHLRARMVLQVHDELVFDAPAAEVDQVVELVKTAMENVTELKVPIVADVAVGPNWRDVA